MRSCLCFCSVVLLLCQSSIAQESTFKTIDSNSDGKVTVEEFKSYASGKLKGFDQMDQFAGKVDADGNGEISKAEFETRKEVYQAMSAAGEEAEETGALVAGDTAADFELQTIDGTVRLSDHFGEDGKPVVVVFSRASW